MVRKLANWLGAIVERQDAPTSEAVIVERKRLVVMQWGLLVAIVAAGGSWLVPFVVQAKAEDTEAGATERGEIRALLDRTARSEEAQDAIKKDVARVEVNVGKLTSDVETVKVDVGKLQTGVGHLQKDVDSMESNV